MPRKYKSAEVEITSTDKTGTGIESAEKKVGSLTKVAKAYFAEIAAAYAASKGIINFIKDTTQAYIAQEDSVVSLDTALRAAGNYTPTLSSELQNLARQLQGTSTYGDEAILSMAGLLESMGHLSGEGLKQAMPLVLDMATSLKMDLNTAAALVAKTLGSSTNALTRYGFSMKEGMTVSEKMAALQEWVARSFKGSAAAMAETFGGKLKQLHNIFGDIKEIIGKMLLEQGAPFINWLLDFLKNGENIQVIAKIVAGFGAIFTTVFATIVAAIKTTINYYKIWAEAITAVDRMLAVLFNPKLWGKGLIKAAYQDLIDTTKKIGLETWQIWMNTGAKVGKAWGAMFHDVDLTITTTASSVSYLGSVTEATAVKMKDFDAVLSKVDDSIAGIALRQRAATAAVIGLGMRTEELTAAMENQVNVQAVMGQMMYDTGQVLDSQTEKISVLREAFTNLHMTQKELAQYIASEFVDSIISGFDAIMTGSKDLKEALKDMIAGFLQALGKLFFIQFLANLFLRPRKAALALAASVAAYAGAAFVRSLAKGGEFTTNGPELIMVGDNPSGKERVSVMPAESPSYGQRPMQGDVYLDGYRVGKWFERESRAKNILTYQGAIVK
jgi:hypothetical protein